MSVAAVYAACFGRKRRNGRWGLDSGKGAEVHKERMDQHLKDMMPSEEEALRSSWLGKLSAESVWTDRRAVLTGEILAFARRHEDRMCDSIPLHEIVLSSIRRIEGDVLRQPGTATMMPPSALGALPAHKP
uniref:Uncharacterized protein n=1 Tax=Hemiselmis andersenii TaxID=464988 RepID=A0A6T8JBF9_HEMAN|mmetsp:Transcript_21258/g.48805  ORF Transcript_21258/g.48805 Transcript_21258/m.48805 type:complete len:131 (+) Transcript_21258:90-482(+)